MLWNPAYGSEQLREFAALSPIEAAGIDEHAANRGAMAAEELRRRVIEQVGAELERLHQVGRRERRIDEQRHARFVRDCRDCRNVEHVETRVA
jgi:hypothetical protein